MAVDATTEAQAPPTADLMAGLSELSRDVTARILQVLAEADTPLSTRADRGGHPDTASATASCATGCSAAWPASAP